MATNHDPAQPRPVAQPGWGTPRSRTIGWHDPAQLAAALPGVAGIDFLRAIRDGQLPPPPMAVLIGARLVEVDAARVVFECTPDESMYNPLGVVHGGLVCTLTDTAAACAVQTTLPLGTGYTSIDLNVSYLRAVTLDGGILRATGTVVKSGRRVAFAAAEVVDGAGRVVATATTTCLIVAAGPVGVPSSPQGRSAPA